MSELVGERDQRRYVLPQALVIETEQNVADDEKLAREVIFQSDSAIVQADGVCASGDRGKSQRAGAARDVLRDEAGLKRPRRAEKRLSDIVEGQGKPAGYSCIRARGVCELVWQAALQRRTILDRGGSGGVFTDGGSGDVAG